jgi:hypothetical protein
MTITRRTALRGTVALSAASLLAACNAVTTTTTGGVTTVTVNVAQLTAWGQAVVSGAQLIAGLPGIVGTAAGATISAVATAAGIDLRAFAAAAGASQTLTFNNTSIPAAIQSLAADGQTLLIDAAGALGGVPAASLQTAQTYINAVQTIVVLLQAAIGTAPAAATLAPRMSETQALAVLGVK